MKPRSISIKVITLFPDFIAGYTQFGIIAKAIQQRLLTFVGINLRASSSDVRGTVDDRPYGGGVGMVLKPDVLYRAIQKALGKFNKGKKKRVILLTPSGKPFSQKDAQRLAKYDELIFVSSRYEGYDERITKFVDEEISIGDYVLMGGELPALVISEAVLRLVPGVIGKIESTEYESFSESMLEYPQYTKPEVWKVGSKSKVASGKLKEKTLQVPKVLLSGHHGNIDTWRKAEALKRTQKRRPDLLVGKQ